MMARACILAGVAVGPLVFAQGDDPLKSPACGQALAALQAARAGAAPPAAVESLRSAAAGACLGSAVQPTRPGRVLQAPVVVPPPQVELPARAAALPPVAPPPPPVAIDRPATPALCDASGCWTSDGTHLRQVTPPLAGPNGPCVQQGALIACP